jgi:deoxyadenosine/deoxycytidine kinase
MKRIMFVGPSGIGKTTLAKFIETKYGIPFISGSMSDLMPDTKEMHHAEFLHQECRELINKDYQLLNLRNKLFKDKETFVTDRSYVDLAAYFIYKQSTNIPECEVDAFLDICKDLTVQQCDLLIYLPLSMYYMKEWPMEDNKKRIINRYYQAQMSDIMGNLLTQWSTSSVIDILLVPQLDFYDRIHMIMSRLD